MNIYIFYWCAAIFFVSCKGTSQYKDSTSLRYLDEYVYAKDTIYPGSTIGGLSDIDYDNHTDQYYLICDDAKKPRFYKVNVDIKNNRFAEVYFQPPVFIENYIDKMSDSAILDLESIRRVHNDQLLYTSEGDIKHGYQPVIFTTDTSGTYLQSFQFPSYFKVGKHSTNQPRHNSVFEGLTLDTDQNGFWAAMESPLLKDGNEPTIQDGGAPVRITHFDLTTKKADEQFTYPLEKLTKDPKGKFGVNGVTAILALNKNTFLVLERGYVAGYGNQGKTVRIYLADTSNATNTLDQNILEQKTNNTAIKSLLFDFEIVRNQLTDQIVDNLEGMTFGPILANGNQSLILVSDNNFNPVPEQLNQFILLELVNN